MWKRQKCGNDRNVKKTRENMETTEMWKRVQNDEKSPKDVF